MLSSVLRACQDIDSVNCTLLGQKGKDILTELTKFCPSGDSGHSGGTNFESNCLIPLNYKVAGSKPEKARRKRKAVPKSRRSLADLGSVPSKVDEEYKFLEKFMSVSI